MLKKALLLLAVTVSLASVVGAATAPQNPPTPSCYPCGGGGN
jgi:hypothetical protein